jgi:hypothetical protein
MTSILFWHERTESRGNSCLDGGSNDLEEDHGCSRHFRMFEALRSLKRLAVTCCLVVGAVPAIASSQGVSSPGDARQLIDIIERIEAKSGELGEPLFDPLLDLSTLYLESGDHKEAGATMQHLADVIRANADQLSFDEAPAIQQLVNAARDSESAKEAWELEHALLALASSHQDDLGAARIARDSALRTLDVLARYVAGDDPPELLWGCYYDTSGRTRSASLAGSTPGYGVSNRAFKPECGAGSRSQARRALLEEAQSYYSVAIDMLRSNTAHTAEELRDWTLDLARVSYRYSSPNAGRRSLLILLESATSNPSNVVERAQALVHLGDWELRYSPDFGARFRDSAIERYAEAYALLDSEPNGQQTIEEIFAPDVPVVVPALLPNPLMSPESAGSSRYLDASFIVAEDGRAERVEILETSTADSRSAERDLVREIKGRRFRPRVVDGAFADAPVTIRYYVAN